jgi:hypothetical protein
MLCFSLLGALLAAAAAWVLVDGLTIDFATNKIRYLPTKRYPLVFDYLYAVCVTGPFLLHRNIYLRIFGCLILGFFGVSILLFNPARYSVWCFFAAVCSIVLYFFVASRSGSGRCRSAPDVERGARNRPQKQSEKKVDRRDDERVKKALNQSSLTPADVAQENPYWESHASRVLVSWFASGECRVRRGRAAPFAAPPNRRLQGAPTHKVA